MQSGLTWEVETTFNGTRHFQRGFLTENAAKNYLEQLKLQEKLKDLGLIDQIIYPTVKELFDKREADITNEAEKVRVKRVFPQFLKLLPPNATIDQVEKHHFKLFTDLRVSEGVKERSANRDINPIARAFSSATDYFSLKN